MNAELITTGTEILLGEIVDTNAAWLAQRLRDLGVNLYYKTTVGDNLGRITQVMRQALGRSDLVLVTGGLGPTVDDVTREAAAAATDCDLALDQGCLADIEALFARWGRSVRDNNRRQAFLPVGAIPVPNPVGTAPGFIVEVVRPLLPPALLICLPGVPREMKHLMQESVEPFLSERLGPDRVVIRSRTLRTVGIGESDIDARIADLMAGSNPTVGLAAHMGQVDVRITARAATESAVVALIEAVAEDLYSRLGRYIYGEGAEPLEGTVARLLATAGHRLAILETNTGGQVAARLAGADPGACQLAAALTWEDVDESACAALGSGVALASQDGAAKMAQWLLSQQPGASLALALCGARDPAAGPYGTYRGETYLGLANRIQVETFRIGVGGVDELAQRWVGNAALNWLRLWLLGQAVQE